MNAIRFTAALSVLILGLAGPAAAGIAPCTMEAEPVVPLTPPDFSGTWSGSDAVIVFNDYGAGLTAVHGIDRGLWFECTGVRVGDVLTCTGSGTTQHGNQLFTYTGRFERQTDGNLSETWQAVFSDGTTAHRRDGKARYRPGLHVAPMTESTESGKSGLRRMLPETRRGDEIVPDEGTFKRSR